MKIKKDFYKQLIICKILYLHQIDVKNALNIIYNILNIHIYFSIIK